MAFSWSDELMKTKFFLKMWRSFALLQVASFFLIAAHNLWLQHSYDQALSEKKDRIILTPAVRSPIRIEYGAPTSTDYILESARRVVSLQENWSYFTVEENYRELFAMHSSHEFENFLKANLRQIGFIDKIKENKMVSSFRWNKEQSKADWCLKLNAACALISGERHIFENGNRPITTVQVAYLIISNSVYPTEERPTALQVNRLIIEDSVPEPYQQLESLYNRAQQGLLPENGSHEKK